MDTWKTSCYIKDNGKNSHETVYVEATSYIDAKSVAKGELESRHPNADNISVQGASKVK